LFKAVICKILSACSVSEIEPMLLNSEIINNGKLPLSKVSFYNDPFIVLIALILVKIGNK
jgi:hypothetical protein